jgi:hypothetical protein
LTTIYPYPSWRFYDKINDEINDKTNDEINDEINDKIKLIRKSRKTGGMPV